MKNILMLILCAVPLSIIQAQNPDALKATQEAFSQLPSILGNWHEESWSIAPLEKKQTGL